MNNPLVHQQSEPLPVSYLPIRHTEGAENKEGFVVFSVPHRLKWLRGFSNEAVWLLKADLSPFCFPSHPWVSIPKIALIKQQLWDRPCSWLAPFLLSLWHSQTMVLLVFKLTFTPMVLSAIRHIPVLRMLWWVSPAEPNDSGTSPVLELFRCCSSPTHLRPLRALGYLILKSLHYQQMNLGCIMPTVLWERAVSCLQHSHVPVVAVWASLEAYPDPWRGARTAAGPSSPLQSLSLWALASSSNWFKSSFAQSLSGHQTQQHCHDGVAAPEVHPLLFASFPAARWDFAARIRIVSNS